MVSKIHYIKRFIFRYLKRSKFIYSINYRSYLRKELKIAKKKMCATNIKTSREIKQEIQYLSKYWRYPAYEYYLYYNLFEKKYSKAELLNYVPPYIFANRYQERLQSHIDLIYYNDKLNQYYLFNKKGIPTPEIFFYMKHGKVYNLSQEQLDEHDLLSLVGVFLAKEGNKLFIKPTQGSGGFGISIVNSYNELLIMIHKLKKDRQTIYIFQKNVQQRTDLKVIHPKSVNTLRVVLTTLNTSDFMKICILRMGCSNAEVDNSAQGGISVGVDLESGELQPVAYGEHVDGGFIRHPDSNYLFSGKYISDWERIKGEILLVGEKLKEFNNFALDVVVTEEGISILELNFHYGIDHIQRTLGGVANKFDIQ